jgi:hypothetical protein
MDGTQRTLNREKEWDEVEKVELTICVIFKHEPSLVTISIGPS